MTKEQNQVWRFFASVKLAITIIFVIAVTSIIGTVIQQGRSHEFYVEEYGPELARLFQVLDFTNMYGSWWFITLLIIFCVNLIVCSIDRLPNAWRMVVLDNLNNTPERLQKMPLKAEFSVKADSPTVAADKIKGLLAGAGWKAQSRDQENGVLLFAQKGAWSRLGAYLVHIGILVIFIGALVGSVFGYKASIMFPEGETVAHVFERKTSEPIPLGFEIHLENFDIKYYPIGMVREFRSDVVINDPELDGPLRTSILVNHPLKHRGLTFYQSSYQPLTEYLVEIQNRETGAKRSFMARPGRQLQWRDEGLIFGVTNTMSDRTGRVHEYEIWFSDQEESPSVFNMRDQQTVTVQRPAGNYSFYIQQRYATGLQVANDPGVWIVYAGCGLMMLGLYACFMVTHRRLWAYVKPADKGGAQLLLCGGSNRNKETFDKRFADLAQRLRQDQSIG
ncbi:cytochrome c biogenesis protein ResB [Desulfurivibrio alkaliphilus]|uniref:ResB family protein n=1 Tax=Desulfurivibrio alkaliphilus (strain DSM 19089 / UNIQEM U267 / AHT2) TaxID=589865 RepID=D6Z6K1_DESAT|nr:cytochrome c biogenesis protein ResB [Desulfurivibrio alkaliphilus]ADH84960.1 ResB family protein [Desulfurivibrio alkaliphilus AHT 2]